VNHVVEHGVSLAAPIIRGAVAGCYLLYIRVPAQLRAVESLSVDDDAGDVPKKDEVADIPGRALRCVVGSRVPASAPGDHNMEKIVWTREI
jgi:hypothetical protein